MRSGVPDTLIALLIIAVVPACSAGPAAEAPTPPGPSVSTMRDSVDGTYRTPPITVAQMSAVARRAGFKPSDIDEYLTSSFGAATSVTYTLTVGNGQWVVFQSVDGGLPEDSWAGPFRQVDDDTVVAGSKPCGPITYDYRLSDDELRVHMIKNECTDADGTVPAGELIAQTTMYDSAPYQRVS